MGIIAKIKGKNGIFYMPFNSLGEARNVAKNVGVKIIAYKTFKRIPKYGDISSRAEKMFLKR